MQNKDICVPYVDRDWCDAILSKHTYTHNYNKRRQCHSVALKANLRLETLPVGVHDHGLRADGVRRKLAPQTLLHGSPTRPAVLVAQAGALGAVAQAGVVRRQAALAVVQLAGARLAVVASRFGCRLVADGVIVRLLDVGVHLRCFKVCTYYNIWIWKMAVQRFVDRRKLQLSG